jgi:hypothetical protein
MHLLCKQGDTIERDVGKQIVTMLTAMGVMGRIYLNISACCKYLGEMQE